MTPQDQIQAQERTILQQRAEIAELKTRVANLQRISDGAQRHIGTLQAKLRRATHSEAEKVFGHGQGS